MGLVDLGEHRLKDLARPEHVYQLIDADIPHEFPALRSLDAHPHNLPSQLSSFIGRVDEITTVAGLLDGNRLVTIAGSGGAGKTRLALQVAAEVIDRYPDGVWWVELAEIVDPDLLPAAIAGAVGVKADVGERAAAELAERLADRRLLVVLDNCEHLIAAVAAMVGLLPRAGGSGGTGHQPGGVDQVPGEVALADLHRLPCYSGRHGGSRSGRCPSSTPYGCSSTCAPAGLRPNFHLSDDNGPVVAGICEQLDGITIGNRTGRSPLPVPEPNPRSSPASPTPSAC